ncbi:MAG: DUF4177 domain-containing protein [Deltaproteobacteria bacterium]|nr:DUF4177 domain-containing protein [Deltaproteobacteria bacterium]
MRGPCTVRRSRGENVSLRYKVVEIAQVTDEEIEKVLNEWSVEGWTLDTIQFAMRDSSRRPSMAFVTFTREEDD